MKLLTQAFLNKFPTADIRTHEKGRFRRPTAILGDGTRISIQAGEFMYSFPRKNNHHRYTEVEVGWVDMKESDNWLVSYANVLKLNEVIKAHGYIVDWDRDESRTGGE